MYFYLLFHKYKTCIHYKNAYNSYFIMAYSVFGVQDSKVLILNCSKVIHCYPALWIKVPSLLRRGDLIAISANLVFK